jgi:hypothetical protein
MIALLAKLMDWLAIQLVWGRRTKSLLKLHNHPPNPKLEEALKFLNGPDFIPVGSPSVRLEFTDARNFRFPTPRPGEFAENNVVYDLFVDRNSLEALWHAWGQPDIWRLPHSHASKILSPSLTGRILRWLAPRLDTPAVRTVQTTISGSS